MTDKNRTAHQRNGRQSRGASTPAGKERSRAAHLRHGFYSQQREEALGALGEDPAELAALIASTREEWQPTSDFQERLTERMARLWWRTERAERIQESLAAREMEEHQKRRRERVQEIRNDFEPQASVLEMLRDYSAQPRFYVPRCLFHHFRLGLRRERGGAAAENALADARVAPAGRRSAGRSNAFLRAERRAAFGSPRVRAGRAGGGGSRGSLSAGCERRIRRGRGGKPVRRRDHGGLSAGRLGRGN
jgi:hypothetical protein